MSCYESKVMFSLMETLMLKIDTFNIHKENFRQKENQIFSSSDWFGVFHFMKCSRTILIKSFIILLCKVCYKLKACNRAAIEIL